MTSIISNKIHQDSWSLSYRSDIDGLRAMAVGAVFLFHLNPAWMPGGFVGVDVFFVLSGYLITTILMRDLQNGGIRLAKFYQRRIARLFPAMLTVVGAILIGAALFYTPQDLASAGINSAAALLSLANVKFYLQGNYFEMSLDAQPLLHFWSLAVEEQYYLFYPLLLMALARFRVSTIGLTLAVVSLISFAACVTFTFINPKAAFYLLPFRAWELGIGGITAFAAQGVWKLPLAKVRAPVALAGFAAILLSFILFDEGMAFPGYAAALPVLGTAALLVAGQNGNYPGRALLSTRPMVAVGAVSYTLYLWHWPIFSFVDYTLFASTEVFRVTLKVLLSIGFTVATYALIEKPARGSFNNPARRLLVFGGFAAALAVMVPLGLTIRQDNYIDASVQQVAEGGLVFPGSENAPDMILVGDSNGTMYSKMLRGLSRDLDYTLHVASVASGDALPNSGGKDSLLWSESLAMVERLKPEVVVIANAWVAKLDNDRSRIDLALERIAPHASHIIILNQPPVLPQEASRARIRDGARPPFYDEAQNRKSINTYLSRFSSETVSVVDVASVFLDVDGSVLFTDTRGRLLYHDAGHISGFGADRVRSLIEDILK